MTHTPLHRILALLFSALSLTGTVMAQSTQASSGTPSATASASYNVFSAIASASPGDGTFGNQPGSVGTDPSTPQSNSNAGASGSNSGFINMTNGARIAIIVVVVVVAVLGSKPTSVFFIVGVTDRCVVSSALFFFIAKKRQWEVRKTLRRSARRFTGSFRPSAQTTSRKGRGLSRVRDSPSPTYRQYPNDLEKGVGMTTTTITGPSASFEMRSQSPRPLRTIAEQPGR